MSTSINTDENSEDHKSRIDHDDDSTRFVAKPVILITGATGAVGYGICLRLLYQLSQPLQSDLSETSSKFIKANKSSSTEEHQSIYATPNGLTLLIACRNLTKGQDTSKRLRDNLESLFNREDQAEREDTFYSYIDRVTGQVETMSFDRYRQRWLDNLTIQPISLDLSRARSIIDAISEVSRSYGYLTHLILNAGGGPFVGLHWPRLFWAFLRSPVEAVTYPDYLVEDPKVTETTDRLSETWQLNVFSHYLLAQEALPLLAKSSSSFIDCSSPSRIVWTSSLDAQRIYFDRSDIQSIKTGHAYQSSKYQCEVLGQGFHEIIESNGFKGKIVSIVAHPGIVAGNMFLPIVGWFMDMMMRWTFHFARLILGSPHHLIDSYSASLVWSYICLTQNQEQPAGFTRYGVQCDRWGNPIVVKEDEEDLMKMMISDEDELKERKIDQNIVLETCQHWTKVLKRLWDLESS